MPLINEISIDRAKIIIEGFYLGFLKCEPDTDGLGHWAQRLHASQNIALILEEIFESDEFQNLTAWGTKERLALLKSIREKITRPINVVDVGSILIGSEKPMWLELSDFSEVNVTGFVPQSESFDRVDDFKNPICIKNRGIALGDGMEHILHINNEINTSSFFRILQNTDIHHLSEIRTVQTALIPTQRLDNLDLPYKIDLLKFDVQGYELEILKHGVEKLKLTSLVFIEVAFSPIYENQPLFSEIDTFMQENGFQLIDLYACKYPMNGVENRSPDLLMWADALYKKVPQDSESMSIQNLILGVLFNKWNLAEFGNRSCHIKKEN